MEAICTGSVHPENPPQSFTLTELSSATNNFSPEVMINEQCFARIYKGILQHNNQLVAIKLFKHTEEQEKHKNFLVEVLMLSHLHHENIINMHGYCTFENHRLIVLENAALHSLKNHLFRPSSHQSSSNASGSKPLDWRARIRIALGVAKGLEYLHNKMSPPVIHRDLQTSNIMLGEDFTPKISNFELAKLGPIGDRKHVTTKAVVGTCGYIAPEYAIHGLVSAKLDVYSFGIVLLELITGRRVYDLIHITEEHDLSSWARAVVEDAQKAMEMVDPQLKGEFQMEDLSKMLAVTAMCLREESEHRPLTTDVVAMLSSLVCLQITQN